MTLTKLRPSQPHPSERWTSVHIPESIHPESIPDERADVFEAVSMIEETSLEFFNLNLIGKTVNQIETNPVLTPLASALLKSGAVHLVNNFFDPIDVLNDKLSDHPVIHSRVMTSMAWMIDMAVVNAARQVLFARYHEHETKGAEEFTAFCHQIVEDLSHPSLYEDEGNEKTLAQLIALRPVWHDEAQSASSADDRDYNPKGIAEQLLAEKPRKTSVGARMNLEILAAKEAKGNDAKKARLMAAFIERDEIQNAERAKGNKQLVPTILAIIDTVSRFAPSETRFDHLAERTQKMLTKQAVGIIERSQADVAKLSKITPQAYGRIVDASYEALEVINDVLATKFNDAGDLENTYNGLPADVEQHDREQKAVAARRED